MEAELQLALFVTTVLNYLLLQFHYDGDGVDALHDDADDPRDVYDLRDVDGLSDVTPLHDDAFLHDDDDDVGEDELPLLRASEVAHDDDYVHNELLLY